MVHGPNNRLLLMLYHLLDTINLIQNNKTTFSTDWLPFLQNKAVLMMTWVEMMRFSNGTIPHFNDSTNGIAPSPQALLNYGQRLNLNPTKDKSQKLQKQLEFHLKEQNYFLEL